MRPITNDDMLRLLNPAHLAYELGRMEPGDQLLYAMTGKEEVDRRMLGHAWGRYEKGTVELVQQRLQTGQIAYWAIGRRHVRAPRKERVSGRLP